MRAWMTSSKSLGSLNFAVFFSWSERNLMELKLRLGLKVIPPSQRGLKYIHKCVHPVNRFAANIITSGHIVNSVNMDDNVPRSWQEDSGNLTLVTFS